jgi:hypothetical protein
MANGTRIQNTSHAPKDKREEDKWFKCTNKNCSGGRVYLYSPFTGYTGVPSGSIECSTCHGKGGWRRSGKE